VRDDFVSREVFFYAERFLPPQDRTLVVSVHLTWLGVPDVGHRSVGGEFERRFLQPLVGDTELDPELVAAVAGPVLDYVNAPTTAQGFIDQLLEFGPRARGIFVPYPPLVHYLAAAWGAALIGDVARHAAAVELVTASDPDAPPEAHEALTAELRAMDAFWLDRHGEAPRARV
jgi:hypothetical protein